VIRLPSTFNRRLLQTVDRTEGGGIALFDRSGKQPRFFDTGQYLPTQVCAPDHSIWTLGWQEIKPAPRPMITSSFGTIPRMDRGAGQADVLRMVMHMGLRLIALGTIASLAGSFGDRLLASQIWGCFPSRPGNAMRCGRSGSAFRTGGVLLPGSARHARRYQRLAYAGRDTIARSSLVILFSAQNRPSRSMPVS